MVADIEELESMDASEIYSKRLNTKEVPWRPKWLPTGFFFDHPIPVQTTRILQKTPEFQKMAIMIFLSELILDFFGVNRG